MICPCCKRKKNYFAPSVEKNFNLFSEIKVCKIRDIDEKNLSYSDYMYNIICENCGYIFQMENDAIMAAIK